MSFIMGGPRDSSPWLVTSGRESWDELTVPSALPQITSLKIQKVGRIQLAQLVPCSSLARQSSQLLGDHAFWGEGNCSKWYQGVLLAEEGTVLDRGGPWWSLLSTICLGPFQDEYLHLGCDFTHALLNKLGCERCVIIL